MSERIDGSYSPIALPALPLEDWKDTKETLHRYAQIVGKVRLEYSPFRNHWWHAPLYVSTHDYGLHQLEGDTILPRLFTFLPKLLPAGKGAGA